MIRDCTICLVVCDPAIHEATLRVRDWLRQRVTFSAPLPVEDKPLRVQKPQQANFGSYRLNRIEKLGIGRPVGRPRKNPPKDKPHEGEGRDWNRLPIADEQIIELRNQGLSYAKIGKQLGMHPGTAFKRMKARGI